MLPLLEISERFERYFHLERRPLFVSGAEEMPEGAIPMGQVDRCVARALIMGASDRTIPPMVIGKEVKERCCPGGLMWLGLEPPMSKLPYFLSTGTPDFRGGEAELLKPTPEAAQRFLQAPGEITPPGRYLIVCGADSVTDEEAVRSMLIIGTAEQVRNLGGLVHYRKEDIFRSVLMPAGAACSSMVTYAAGMASRAPRDTAYVGPVDPTGNPWFPPDALSFAAPIEMVRQMAEDIPSSFIGKRAELAFPARNGQANGQTSRREPA